MTKCSTPTCQNQAHPLYGSQCEDCYAEGCDPLQVKVHAWLEENHRICAEEVAPPGTPDELARMAGLRPYPSAKSLAEAKREIIQAFKEFQKR